MQIALADDRVRPSPLAVPQTPKHDTGELSIWEVFGLRRPASRTEVLDSLVQWSRRGSYRTAWFTGAFPSDPCGLAAWRYNWVCGCVWRWKAPPCASTGGGTPVE